MKYAIACLLFSFSLIGSGQCTVGNSMSMLDVMQSLENTGITSGNDLTFCISDSEDYIFAVLPENIITVEFTEIVDGVMGQTGSYSGGGGGILIDADLLFTATFIAQQTGEIEIVYDNDVEISSVMVDVTGPSPWEIIVADMIANNPHEVARSYEFILSDLRLPIRISEFFNCPGETGPSRFTITFTDVETGNIIHVLDQNCEVAEILPNSEVNVTFDPISPGDTQIEWSSDNVTTQTATLTSAFVLPIELSGFTATATQKQTHLSWQTASESQNRGFHLQHSPNGQTWSPLDFIPGVGDSQTERDYAYTHRNPVPGTNYYRLEQEDYDGTRTLSEVVTAEFDGVAALAVFPNPATDLVAITQTSESSAPYELRDSNGRTLLNLPATVAEFSVADLPAGIYLLRRVGEQAAVKVVVR